MPFSSPQACERSVQQSDAAFPYFKPVFGFPLSVKGNLDVLRRSGPFSGHSFSCLFALVLLDFCHFGEYTTFFQVSCMFCAQPGTLYLSLDCGHYRLYLRPSLLVFVSLLRYFMHLHIQIQILNLCTQTVVCHAHVHVSSFLGVFCFGEGVICFTCIFNIYLELFVHQYLENFFLLLYMILHCFDIPEVNSPGPRSFRVFFTFADDARMPQTCHSYTRSVPVIETPRCEIAGQRVTGAVGCGVAVQCSPIWFCQFDLPPARLWRSSQCDHL